MLQAAEEAKARRASGGLDDATPVSPRPDLARLQVCFYHLLETASRALSIISAHCQREAESSCSSSRIMSAVMFG